MWQVAKLTAQAPTNDPETARAATLVAVEQTPEAVEAYFSLLRGYDKPLHLHLHDGHPLAPRSLFGVADHLGFFAEIPCAVPYKGRPFLPTIYGPLGLQRLVRALRAQVPARLLSWTMEIHPRGGRLPLGPAAELFAHWRDLGNAEETNFWLDELLRNCRLLAAILAQP